MALTENPEDAGTPPPPSPQGWGQDTVDIIVNNGLPSDLYRALMERNNEVANGLLVTPPKQKGLAVKPRVEKAYCYTLREDRAPCLELDFPKNARVLKAVSSEGSIKLVVLMNPLATLVERRVFYIYNTGMSLPNGFRENFQVIDTLWSEQQQNIVLVCEHLLRARRAQIEADAKEAEKTEDAQMEQKYRNGKKKPEETKAEEGPKPPSTTPSTPPPAVVATITPPQPVGAVGPVIISSITG